MAPVTDNRTHLSIVADASDPDSEASLSVVELVECVAAVGVIHVMALVCEITTWQESLALARQPPGVRVALVVHPSETVLYAGVRETDPDGLTPRAQGHHAESFEEVMVRLEETLRANADVIIAVGEGGLDFSRTGEKGAVVRREAFRVHIVLAKDLGLPLQIHDRDAHAACVEVLGAGGAPARTVFHCFSGGSQLAATYTEHGWCAPIAGPLTYPANDTLRRAVVVLPESLLLVETDAPYLPSKRWCGRPDAPYPLGDMVRFLAEQRSLSEGDFCRRLQATTETVYRAW